MDIGISTRTLTDHTLTTEGLYLRPAAVDDLPEYVGLLTDSGVMKYIGVEAGQIPAIGEILSLLEGAVSAWENRGYGRWSIYDRRTEDFVGFTGFRCEAGVPELLSVVHERFWGTGYAYEAGKACIDYAFDRLGFTQVCAYSRPANIRARALLDRIGFKFEGVRDFHGVQGSAYLLRR